MQPWPSDVRRLPFCSITPQPVLAVPGSKPMTITVSPLRCGCAPGRALRPSSPANRPGVRGCLRGCLLYTSDAADEEDSVDLGGRRIIKKKKKYKKNKEIESEEQ